MPRLPLLLLLLRAGGVGGLLHQALVPPSYAMATWDTWAYYANGTWYYYYDCHHNPAINSRWGLAISADGVHWDDLGEACPWCPGTPSDPDAMPPWMATAPDAGMGTGTVWKRVDFEQSKKYVVHWSHFPQGGQDFAHRARIYFAESTDLIRWTYAKDDVGNTSLPLHFDIKPGPGYYTFDRWDTIYPIQKAEHDLSAGYWGYWTAHPTPYQDKTLCQGFGFGESDDGLHWTALPAPRLDFSRTFSGTPLPPNAWKHGPTEVGGVERLPNGLYYAMVDHAGGGSGSYGMSILISESPSGPFRPSAKNYDIHSYNMSSPYKGAMYDRFFRGPENQIMVTHQVITREHFDWPRQEAPPHTGPTKDCGKTPWNTCWTGCPAVDKNWTDRDACNGGLSPIPPPAPDGSHQSCNLCACNHHNTTCPADPKGPGTICYMSTFKLAVLDPHDNLTLQYMYWAGLEKVKGLRLPFDASARLRPPQHDNPPARLDLTKGVVLEAHVDLPKAAMAEQGVFIESGVVGAGAGSLITFSAAGVFQHLEVDAKGKLTLVNTWDREYNFTRGDGGRHLLRLLIRKSLYELYLDDLFITNYGTLEWNTGFVSLWGDAVQGTISNVELWQMSLDGAGVSYLKPATASSSAAGDNGPAMAVDGNSLTFWASADSTADRQWLRVDLGSTVTVTRAQLHWQGDVAFASHYEIQTQRVATAAWTTAFSTATGDGSWDVIRFAAVACRRVQVVCLRAGGPSPQFALYSFELYSSA